MNKKTVAHSRKTATSKPSAAPHASAPTLHQYDTGEELRDATPDEVVESVEAARHDGGAGVIEVDGVRCYVVGDAPGASPTRCEIDWSGFPGGVS